MYIPGPEFLSALKRYLNPMSHPRPDTNCNAVAPDKSPTKPAPAPQVLITAVENGWQLDVQDNACTSVHGFAGSYQRAGRYVFNSLEELTRAVASLLREGTYKRPESKEEGTIHDTNYTVWAGQVWRVGDHFATIDQVFTDVSTGPGKGLAYVTVRYHKKHSEPGTRDTVLLADFVQSCSVNKAKLVVPCA